MSAPTTTNGSAANYKPYPVPGMLKGALIAKPRSGSGKTVEVPFQYNPNKLSRTLTPQYYACKDNRFDGPPKQAIDITVQLECSSGERNVRRLGVGPYLAALELMIYPSSSDYETWVKKTDSNKISVVPVETPRSLFVWGPNRVLPVQLTSVTVTETIFNEKLTPVVADVALKMDLYPYAEAAEKDQQLLLTNLKILESLRSKLPSLTNADIGIKSVSSL